MAPVICNGCGQRLEVPAGFTKAKMRCPECGVFTELPPEVREQAQTTAARAEPPAKAPRAEAPRPPRPTPPPEEQDTSDTAGYAFLSEPETKPPPPPTAKSAPPANQVPEREVLIEGTEEDDLNPYTVTGDAPSKRCPECEKKVEAQAKVCVHCGYNFESKEKAKRTFQVVLREWENGWPLKTRVMVFVILQVVNFVTLVLSVVNDFGLGMSFVMVLMAVGLQAFLCGTWDTLTLTRNQKGKVVLTTTWRYAFIPFPPKTIPWKEHESILIVQSNEFDPIDWAFAFILLGYCVVPGVLFWWFFIRPDKFAVTLCKDHGFPETPIFRTTNEERAKEVLTVVSDVTTLPVHK